MDHDSQTLILFVLLPFDPGVPPLLSSLLLAQAIMLLHNKAPGPTTWLLIIEIDAFELIPLLRGTHV